MKIVILLSLITNSNISVVFNNLKFFQAIFFIFNIVLSGDLNEDDNTI